jgi:thiamine biosynthesis lipoprotein
MQAADRPPAAGPTRRQFLTLGVGVFAVTAVPLARRRRARLVRRAVPMMGTLADVGVVHENPVYAHAAIDAALDELWRVERVMSRFLPDSDVGRANRLAARDAVDVSAATAAVLAAALDWAVASDGAFDPCLGRASELWDVGRRTAPPPEGGFRRLAGRRLYRALDVERGARCRVRLTDPDAAIDLGGIAKGYAVDRAADALRRWGVTRGLVNVGGDLYALGRSADDDPWRVGIRSPVDPDALLGTLDVEDAAVATSGDYERFFRFRGRRFHHLLDPATAAPRLASLHSVTVRAPTCIAADAAATATFGLDAAEAGRILRRGDARAVRVGAA